MFFRCLDVVPFHLLKSFIAFKSCARTRSLFTFFPSLKSVQLYTSTNTITLLMSECFTHSMCILLCKPLNRRTHIVVVRDVARYYIHFFMGFGFRWIFLGYNFCCCCFELCALCNNNAHVFNNTNTD